MARGWESKYVEDQIHERENESSGHTRRNVSREDIQRQSKRDSILMVRNRMQANLNATSDAKHRAHLERVLADLDEQLLSHDLLPIRCR